MPDRKLACVDCLFRQRLDQIALVKHETGGTWLVIAVPPDDDFVKAEWHGRIMQRFVLIAENWAVEDRQFGALRSTLLRYVNFEISPKIETGAREFVGLVEEKVLGCRVGVEKGVVIRSNRSGERLSPGRVVSTG
nr:hypothetical protein [Sinorhizobium meliloti]